MRKTALGNTGQSVSALGLGCAGMRDAAGSQEADRSVRAMRAAFEHGVDLFDTADLYGVGRSEELVGTFLKQGVRTQVVVATKFGSMPGSADGVGSGPRSVNNDPAYVPLACDASLRRLGTDVIDLYYLHRRDPAVPIADSVGAMARLVEAGKIRWIGLSEVSAATLRAAHAVHPITALQSEYSLWMREREDDVLPVCRELGVTMVPFSPLGRGFLTGSLDVGALPDGDFRTRLPRFQGDAAAHNRRLVDALAAFAASRGATAGQMALAWLIAQGCLPIPGTRDLGHLADNVAAADLALSAADCDLLARMFAPDAVMGARYTADEAARAGT